MPRLAGDLTKPTVRVVAAVIYDEARRVLVAQRPEGKALAGQWEFPGGKTEAGESDASALRRELREELGVRVDAASPLLEFSHEYAERHVQLSVWLVERFGGEPSGREGQQLRGVMPAALRGPLYSLRIAKLACEVFS